MDVRAWYQTCDSWGESLHGCLSASILCMCACIVLVCVCVCLVSRLIWLARASGVNNIVSALTRKRRNVAAALYYTLDHLLLYQTYTDFSVRTRHHLTQTLFPTQMASLIHKVSTGCDVLMLRSDILCADRRLWLCLFSRIPNPTQKWFKSFSTAKIKLSKHYLKKNIFFFCGWL